MILLTSIHTQGSWVAIETDISRSRIVPTTSEVPQQEAGGVRKGYVDSSRPRVEGEYQRTVVIRGAKGVHADVSEWLELAN